MIPDGRLRFNGTFTRAAMRIMQKRSGVGRGLLKDNINVAADLQTPP
jgi:hypothetical protein